MFYMFSRLTNKVVSIKIWRIIREESESMTNTDEGCEWTMFWGQCSLFEVAEAVRKLVKSLESCFPAKRVTVVVFLWYCPKTMVSLLLSKSRKYYWINLTNRLDFAIFKSKISYICEPNHTLLDLLHTTRWMQLQWATKMHKKLR